MSTWLRRIGLTDAKRDAVGAVAGSVRSFSEFADALLESLDKSRDVAAALSRVTPWAQVIGRAAADTVPVVRFFATLLHEITREADPNKIGLLAATIAYQRSVELALRASKLEPRGGIRRSLNNSLVDDYDFAEFSYESAPSHPFMRDAELVLHQLLSDGFVVDESATRAIVMDARSRFVTQLRLLVSSDATEQRFRAFRLLAETPVSKADAAHRALVEHAMLQRWVFDEAPMLPGESFPLSWAYVETDCGRVVWGDVSREDGKVYAPHENRNAFSERCGGRRNAVSETVSMLFDSAVQDAIVIQGVAGAGKSSLTLRLSDELLRRSMVPVRIRLKDLPIDRELRESLGHAVNRTLASDPRGVKHELQMLCSDQDMFSDALLSRTIKNDEGREVCPYVLILDGWDELTVSSSDDFRRRVETTLRRIRDDLLSRFGNRVRVVLTGRPSNAVDDAGFMKRTTPLLTMRPFTAAQLGSYVRRLAWALDATESDWRINPDDYRDVVAHYAESDAMSEDVMGHPLLAFIALRVHSARQLPTKVLINDRTQLLRELVDLTTKQAAKAPEDEDDAASAKFRGSELRRLLRIVAASMTAAGAEAISERELERRLQGWDGDSSCSASDYPRALRDGSVFARLMISFYFRPGNERGAYEFAHKSFREYLFAEELVGSVKALAREASFNYSHGGSESSARALSRLFAADGAMNTTHYVIRLLRWEISRAYSQGSSGDLPPAMSPTDWRVIRDKLADLWAWYLSGVLERPQVRQDSTGNRVVEEPLALWLSKWLAPSVGDRRGDVRFREPSSCASDVGEWIFFLCVAVHHEIARRDVPGWGGLSTPPGFAPEQWVPHAQSASGGRRHQTLVSVAGQHVVLFAPGDPDSTTHLHTLPVSGIVAKHATLDLRRMYLDTGDVSWSLIDHAALRMLGDELVLRVCRGDSARINAERVRVSGCSLPRARIEVGSSVFFGRSAFERAVILIPLGGRVRVLKSDSAGATIVPQWPQGRLSRWLPPTLDGDPPAGLDFEQWSSLAQEFQGFLSRSPLVAELNAKLATARGRWTEWMDAQEKATPSTDNNSS